jgi:hypothetical protein
LQFVFTVDRWPGRRVIKFVAPIEILTVLQCTKGIAAGRELIGVAAPGHQIPIRDKMGRKVIKLNGNN